MLTDLKSVLEDIPMCSYAKLRRLKIGTEFVIGAYRSQDIFHIHFIKTDKDSADDVTKIENHTKIKTLAEENISNFS